MRRISRGNFCVLLIEGEEGNSIVLLYMIYFNYFFLANDLRLSTSSNKSARARKNSLSLTFIKKKKKKTVEFLFLRPFQARIERQIRNIAKHLKRHSSRFFASSLSTLKHDEPRRVGTRGTTFAESSFSSVIQSRDPRAFIGAEAVYFRLAVGFQTRASRRRHGMSGRAN